MNFCISFNGKPLIFNNIHNISTRVSLSGCKENELLLVFRKDINGNSFSLLSPYKIPIGYLAEKKIFNHDFLQNHFTSDASIKDLRNAVMEIIDIENLNHITCVLIFYFFFSASMSVTQMADWFIESGVSSEDSESLAMAIYMAGTGRQDVDLNFIINQDNSIFNSPEPEFPEIHIFNSGKSLFNYTFPHDTSKTRFLFDEYQQYCKSSGENNQELYYCGDIPETSFLVEDHGHLILGISCRLSEVMSICEFSAPQFYTFIKYHSSFSERTYRSLGGFLEEFYSEVIELVYNTGMHYSIKLLDNQNKTFAINLKNCISPLGFSLAIPGYLPVFMDIEKAHQTVVSC